MTDYLAIAFFLFLGPVVAVGAMLAGKFLATHSKETRRKRDAYECGEDLQGNARIQFKVGYYIFALLFLVFDIESLLLFPAVRVFRQVAQGNGQASFGTLVLVLDLALFVFILGCGLAYAWKKGALKWE